MSGSSVKYWLILAAALVAMYGSFVAARHYRPNTHAEVGPAVPDTEASAASARPRMTEFELTDQDGKPFDSNSLRGKVWVASFFFTNCPAVCWRLNQTLAAMQQTNPTSDVRYVSITCDPDNDTPEALKKYADHFKADPARWTFLTGKLDLITRIGQDFFRISVEKAGHTDRACVVDRQGQIRGSFRLTQPDQVEMLKKLLSVVEAEPNEPNNAETPSKATPPQTENTTNEPVTN